MQKRLTMIKKEKHKEIELGKYDTLSECLDAYDKLMDEGRNVFWGQYPEGYYVIVEYLKQE